MAEQQARRACHGCGAPSHRGQSARFVCRQCGVDNQVNRAELGGEQSRVIPLREMKRDRRHLQLVEPLDPRPQTRADCIDGPRPCPWVGCRHHLGLEVTRAGGLKPTFPDVDPDEVQSSCALDLAERGTLSLDEIGKRLNLTRERTRQIFETALQKLRLAGSRLKEYL